MAIFNRQELRKFVDGRIDKQGGGASGELPPAAEKQVNTLVEKRVNERLKSVGLESKSDLWACIDERIANYPSESKAGLWESIDDRIANHPAVTDSGSAGSAPSGGESGGSSSGGDTNSGDSGAVSEQMRNDGRLLVGESEACDYRTIQAAVDAAPAHEDISGRPPGAHIYVTPSYDGRAHQESVRVENKQVRIEGHERSSAAVYPKDGHYAFVVEGTSSYDYPSTRSIENMSVCGGKGALLGAGLVQFKMESVQVCDAEEAIRLTTGEGLHTDKKKPVNVEQVFRDINCHFMKGDVFNLEWGSANNKTVFDSCTVNRTDGRAFNVTGASTEIKNATVQFCKKGGIRVHGGPTLSVSILGSYFEANGGKMDDPKDIEITTGRGTRVVGNYFNGGSKSKTAVDVTGGTGAIIRENTYNKYEKFDDGAFVSVASGAKATEVGHTTNNGNAPLFGTINDEILSHGHRLYSADGTRQDNPELCADRYGARGVATDT